MLPGVEVTEWNMENLTRAREMLSGLGETDEQTRVWAAEEYDVPLDLINWVLKYGKAARYI